MIELKRNK